jgi:glycosyltransferase involved in cell wall biosynthesis
LEIVVVDDCSTDATQNRLGELQVPALRVLQTGVNCGAAAARNLGIAHSSGDLIAFLDSDDAWDVRKIEWQVACFANGPIDLGAVYTGLTVHHRRNRVAQRMPKHRGNLFNALKRRNVVGSASSVMVRRAVLDEIGLFDTRLPACEDWDLWARISRRHKFDFIAEPCVHYYTEGEDRLSHRARSVFIANHLIFRRLNGHRPERRNLSTYLALQSRELFRLGRRQLALRFAIYSLWLRPLQRERTARNTLWRFVRHAMDTLWRFVRHAMARNGARVPR